MSELCRLRRSEGYGACSDEGCAPAPWLTRFCVPFTKKDFSRNKTMERGRAFFSPAPFFRSGKETIFMTARKSAAPGETAADLAIPQCGDCRIF